MLLLLLLNVNDRAQSMSSNMSLQKCYYCELYRGQWVPCHGVGGGGALSLVTGHGSFFDS